MAASSVPPALAGIRKPTPVQARARGAHQVVVATVDHVSSRFARNRFGDDLIVSDVTLRVSEGLKGARDGQVLQMVVEGGTVGDLTLHVSDIPALRRGERAVFLLEQDGQVLVPHQRGDGILKIDRENFIPSEHLRLDEVRAFVLGAR
jgi:hypothetical protein